MWSLHICTTVIVETRKSTVKPKQLGQHDMHVESTPNFRVQGNRCIIAYINSIEGLRNWRWSAKTTTLVKSNHWKGENNCGDRRSKNPHSSLSYIHEGSKLGKDIRDKSVKDVQRIVTVYVTPEVPKALPSPQPSV